MKAHLVVTDEDYEVARVEEKRRRHVYLTTTPFSGNIISLLTRLLSCLLGCHGGKRLAALKTLKTFMANPGDSM